MTIHYTIQYNALVGQNYVIEDAHIQFELSGDLGYR